MPLRALTPSDRVGRDGEALCAEIDGEIVALNVAKGVCYGFDAISSHIWALIEPSMRIDKLCDLLMRRYAVDRPTCERQVIDLLEDLRSEGLLTAVVAVASGSPAARD